MARFFTKSFFSTISRNNSEKAKQWMNESIQGTQISAKFDIFLSHSFLDREVVRGIYLYLTGLGYKVYVDWIIDQNLDRSNINSDTVNLIRKRMKDSKSLIYAASNAASQSKWMPWELGFIDSQSEKKCFVLPVADISTESFKGHDFLLVYELIEDAGEAGFSDKMKIRRNMGSLQPLNESISFSQSRKSLSF